MKKGKKMEFKRLIIGVMSISLLTGCQSVEKMSNVQEETEEVEIEDKNLEQEEIKELATHIEENTSQQYPLGSDVRGGVGEEAKEISEQGLSKELIVSYWFNEETDFKGFEKVADEIMEEGKNPGLGVRTLHQKGITGEGVNVAIIDQPLKLNHPEYKGKIVEYKDLCEGEGGESSMHGPAVTSILVGETIGVAPEANVYYVSAPSWTRDAAYQAEALKCIIEWNKALPMEQKIHVVSVSAAPSGQGSPFNKNNNQWDEAVQLANEEGILVLDCTNTYGKIAPCYYDEKDREDGSQYIIGFSKSDGNLYFDKSMVFAPVSYRTTAETYEKGSYSYQYMGTGGLSWAIPYAAGTLALGWQVNPELTGEEAMKLLSETATINQEGYRIINPLAFVEAAQAK